MKTNAEHTCVALLLPFDSGKIEHNHAVDFEKDNFWASFWNGRNVCADPFVGGHILCRITVEKIRMNKLKNMATHLFRSYLCWKGDTRNRIWLWLHFVPWYVFDFRFCVRIIQCVFDLILWNCFALFSLKKIEKKNYSKTSNQKFVFFSLDYRHQQDLLRAGIMNRMNMNTHKKLPSV